MKPLSSRGSLPLVDQSDFDGVKDVSRTPSGVKEVINTPSSVESSPEEDGIPSGPSRGRTGALCDRSSSSSTVAAAIFSLYASISIFMKFRLKGPPDGGLYGWLIIWASFLVFFLVIGLEAVWGLLLENMLSDQHLGASRTILALAQGLAMFVELALGAPVAHLCDRFGVRIVVAGGGICLGLGLGFAAVTPNGAPALLLLTYSIVAGSGMAFAYGAACVSLGAAFTTKVTLANAVAGLGIGVGTLVLSQLVAGLMVIGSWRYAMGVVAVIECIGLLIAAASFVPIDPAPLPSPPPVVEAEAEAKVETTTTAGTGKGAGTSAVNVHGVVGVGNARAGAGMATPPHTALSVLTHPHPSHSISFPRRGVKAQAPTSALASAFNTFAINDDGDNDGDGYRREGKAPTPLALSASAFRSPPSPATPAPATSSSTPTNRFPLPAAPARVRGSYTGTPQTTQWTSLQGTPQSPFLLADGHSAAAGAIMPSLSFRRDVFESAARRRAATLGATPCFGPALTPRFGPQTGPPGTGTGTPRFGSTLPTMQQRSAANLCSRMTPALKAVASIGVGVGAVGVGAVAVAGVCVGVGVDVEAGASTAITLPLAVVAIGYSQEEIDRALQAQACVECGAAWPEPEPVPVVLSRSYPLPAFLAALVRLIPRRVDGPDAGDASVEAAASLWRDSRFLSIATCFALVVSMLSVGESHLGAALVEAGHSPAIAANVYSIMGAVGIVFRLFIGFATLYYEVDVTALIQISSVTCGVAIMGLSAHSHDVSYVYLYSSVIGALGGMCYSLNTPLLLEVFGFERLPIAIGAMLSFRAPAVLVAGPLAGLLRDASGSFSAVWTITGVLCVLSALPLGALTFKCTKRGPAACERLD